MADDITQRDVLPLALQSVVDKKLTSGETVLISLAGASGEGLVATDLRVMILREQMPVIGTPTGVDCFDHSYEQIQTVSVEGAVGGGHLKLTLFTPPGDDHQVTLFFPSYELTKFDAAAARIRLLVEQTRGLPPDAPAPARAGSEPASLPACGVCGEPLQKAYMFCAACGAPQGRACRYCSLPVQRGSRFCPYCGNPAEDARELYCESCKQPVAAGYAYCPRCGRAQGRLCPHCGSQAHASWVRCARCGRALDGAAPTNRPADPRAPQGAERPAVAAAGNPAEDHNRRGMELYEAEQYDAAAAEFHAALDIDPDAPLYHCNLGVVYADQGRDADALAQYEEALRLAPNDPTAYLNLGYYHSERENAEEADRMWQKVIELAPESPEADEARENLAHEAEL